MFLPFNVEFYLFPNTGVGSDSGGHATKVIGWRFDEESRQLASMIDYSMLDPTKLENYALLEKEACITSLKDAIEQIERKSNLEGREHD